MRRLACLALLVFVSCSSNETPRPDASPSGPPTIQPDVIQSHAEQFEEELPEREAGSQQEFAAATYITAHLQQAGYVVEFDAVPVANTVRSTNVVALPPSTEDPEYLVAVAYDGSGTAGIAVFLELARALRVAVPDHSIEFVAMGAQHTDMNAGALGARQMVSVLQDRDLDPYVLEIGNGTPSALGNFFKSYHGPLEGRLDDKGFKTNESMGTLATEVFKRAGFDYTLFAGNPDEVAGRLLEFLAEQAG